VPPHPPHPPVLLLGSGLTVLGVLRLLGQAGYTPMVVGRPGVAERSRWFRRCPASRSAATPESDLPAWLDGLPIERAVLIPCGDDWALRIAKCAPDVEARFPSSSASYESLSALVDKGGLAHLLDTLALPHPRTLPIDATTDVAGLPDAMLENVFVKPRDSAAFFRAFGAKAFRVSSRTDLAARLADVQRHGLSVELQEYVPGPPSNHYYVEGFIDRHGSRRALFVRRRRRMFPPDFGNSTSFESVAPTTAPDAVATVDKLLSHIGYRGVFSAELKRDERDGTFRLIEVNARPWWFVEFAGQCGVNVCEMAVLDALGEPVPDVTGYVVGKSCVYPYYDYFACRQLRDSGDLSVAGWASSWLRATQPVLRWSDPMPAFGETARWATRRVTSFFRRDG
jgi:D-aspartate ligase